MDEIKLSRLVGVVSKFTDQSGESRRVIVTRYKPDGDWAFSSAIEGYSMTCLDQYFTNPVGCRMPILPDDRIVAL